MDQATQPIHPSNDPIGFIEEVHGLAEAIPTEEITEEIEVIMLSAEALSDKNETHA